MPMLALMVASCAPPNTSATAGVEDNDWLYPGKTLSNNRYIDLSQITPDNVKNLGKAWETEIIDNGQQESALLVSDGTMYFATPHDNVLAVDSSTGKVKWQFPYNPAYELVYTVSRGVGLQDARFFLRLWTVM